MSTTQGYFNFFNKQAEPPETLDDYELEIKLKELSRKIHPINILVPVMIILPFFTFIFVFLSGILFPGIPNSIFYLVPVSFLGFAVLIIITTKRAALEGKVRSLVGHNLVRSALAREFELEECAAEKYIDAEIIRATTLLSTWNRESGSYYIQGKYKGVSFSFSCLDLRYRSSGKNSTTSTIFKGQWITIRFSKDLPFTMQTRLKKQFWGRDKESDVETNNEDFNKKYRIKTSDPQMALSILTPRLTDFIINKDDQANGQTYLHFMSNHVHIALNNGRNLFEVKSKEILRGMTIGDIRDRIREDYSKYIARVLDEFLLNSDLFR